MTNFVKTVTLAAAALLVATGAASAQSLKADIPFAFHVGNKLLPAGTYNITNVSHSASPILAMRSTEGSSALAMGRAPHDASSDWAADGRPRLAFECGDTCSLVQIWGGSGYAAYDLSKPKNAEMGIRIAVIVVHGDKAD